MSYSKAKGRSKGPKHIQLWHSMHDSEAWCSLSLPARCVWFEVMRRFNGHNNGDIALACREAADLCHISKGTASKAFKELMDKGFIRVGCDSSFSYKKKEARRWVITHYKLNDKAPTNEWRDWKSE